MGYYDLAREARLTLSTLKKNLNTLNSDDDTERKELTTEISTLQARLHDLGIRVASALVEMEDLEGAARFLKTLEPGEDSSRLENQKALLYLSLGDINSARSCISENTGRGEDEVKVIQALAHIADADYKASARIWESLLAGDDSGKSTVNEGENAMYRQNLAVCYLYLGKMDDVSFTLIPHPLAPYPFPFSLLPSLLTI
jgi:hypothetical protein